MKFISHLALILFSCAAVFGQTLSPEEAKKRIAEVMPAALPQRPAVKPVLSDASVERLKGKVKSVTRWTKNAEDGTSWQLGSVDDYDENGYLLRSISYDHMGNPWRVRVFGYLDEKRVSKSAYISYPYDPPAPPAPVARGPAAPRDHRYEYSHEHKYDSENRLAEQILRGNNGEVIGLTKFLYDDGKVKRSRVDKSGAEMIEGIDEYNPKGEILRTMRPAFSRYAESLYEYKYETFDAKGNWLERTVTGKTGQWGGKQKDSNWIEKREITYY